MAKHLRGSLLAQLTQADIDRLVELGHLKNQPDTDLFWTQGGPSRWSQEGKDIWAKRPKHGNQRDPDAAREEHVRRCRLGNCQEFYPMHLAGGSQCGDLTPCRICGEPIVCFGKKESKVVYGEDYRAKLYPEDETGELPKPPWASGQQLELFLPGVPA